MLEPLAFEIYNTYALQTVAAMLFVLTAWALTLDRGPRPRIFWIGFLMALAFVQGLLFGGARGYRHTLEDYVEPRLSSTVTLASSGTDRQPCPHANILLPPTFF